MRLDIVFERGISFSEGYSDTENLLAPPMGISSKLLDEKGLIICSEKGRLEILVNSFYYAIIAYSNYYKSLFDLFSDICQMR